MLQQCCVGYCYANLLSSDQTIGCLLTEALQRGGVLSFARTIDSLCTAVGRLLLCKRTSAAREITKGTTVYCALHPAQARTVGILHSALSFGTRIKTQMRLTVHPWLPNGIRPKKKKSCLVVLHCPPLIFENWKKVFTVQKYTAPNFQNSKKSFLFL